MMQPMPAPTQRRSILSDVEMLLELEAVKELASGKSACRERRLERDLPLLRALLEQARYASSRTCITHPISSLVNEIEGMSDSQFRTEYRK